MFEYTQTLPNKLVSLFTLKEGLLCAKYAPSQLIKSFTVKENAFCLLEYAQTQPNETV